MESKPYLRVFAPNDFSEFPKGTFIESEEQQDRVFENKPLQKHVVQEQEILQSETLEGELLKDDSFESESFEEDSLEGELLEMKLEPLEDEFLQQQPVKEGFLDNDMLLRQLQFLSRPFQQKVYQPLIIVMKNGERFFGKIQFVEQSTIHIDDGQQQFTIEGNDIQEILWQNKPFPKM